MQHWPSVGVVIPTRSRPELLRAAIASIRVQDYPGELSITVVFDGEPPDRSLETPGPVPVQVCVNDAKPGLPGTRNTGILGARTDLVAFCDDDDRWLPGKLRTQVAAFCAEPGAEFATTAIVIEYEGHSSPRLAGTDRVQHSDLLRSRLAMLHSSTFLVLRSALLDGLGLVDENAPGGQNEDYDLLLRAARRRPIVHCDQPLVAVRWGSTSMFATQWQTKVDALRWLLDRHPELTGSAVGIARIYGQLAFGSAALGNRRDAARWAWRSVRAHASEPRAYLALAVASGLVSSGTVLGPLHRHGRGI